MSEEQPIAERRQPRRYVLKAEAGCVNFSGFAFRRWAHDYLACMRSFALSDRFSPVPYFLLCRAIELHLKGQLLMSLGDEAATCNRRNGRHELAT